MHFIFYVVLSFKYIWSEASIDSCSCKVSIPKIFSFFFLSFVPEPESFGSNLYSKCAAPNYVFYNLWYKQHRSDTAYPLQIITPITIAHFYKPLIQEMFLYTFLKPQVPVATFTQHVCEHQIFFLIQFSFFSDFSFTFFLLDVFLKKRIETFLTGACIRHATNILSYEKRHCVHWYWPPSFL